MCHCQSLQSREDFTRANTEGSLQGANKTRLEFVKKTTSEKAFFRQLILRSTCTRMTGRKKYGEGLEQLMIQSTQHYLWNMVEQCDGMSVYGFQWHWVTGVYCRMYSEVYRDILSSQIQPNAAKLIGRCFSTNGQWAKTYSKSNPWVFEGKKVEYSAMAKSISWSQPDWAAFHSLKTKLKTERPTNKQQLKSAAVKAWQSITKEETQSLVMTMSSRLKPVIACKRFSTKY